MAFVVGLCVGAFVGAVVTAILVQRDEEQRDEEQRDDGYENENAFFARIELEWPNVT